MLWNHAALKVLDVRRTILQPGEHVHGYQLPASVFVYARGRAQILLDNIVYAADKCHICHAGKGTFLDIVNVSETFEYFMVFYKAVLTLPSRKELLRLQERSNPFNQQFGFVPRQPLALFSRMEDMHRLWMQMDMLGKFHVKAIFHQMIYEWLEQVQEQGGEMTGPEPVGQAIRYMQEHYAEQMTLQGLAELLDCNARQLQRLFKAKVGMGPMDYLIQLRLSRAKSLLQHTDVPLAQIAEDIGYMDSYYFGRIFKKHIGVSPGRFREQFSQAERCRHNPLQPSQLPIVPSKLQSYSELSEDENHFQERGGNPRYTYSGTRASIAVSFILTLSLLLSVCALPTLASARSVYESRTSPTDATLKGSAVVQAERKIDHARGQLTLGQTPDHIIVLDAQYIDQLLALGKQPCGSVITTSDASTFPAYVSHMLDDVKVMGTKEKPDLEAIRLAAPDLIVCTELQAEVYDELVKIAPTLQLERNADWRSTLRTFGQILGKEQEVPDVLAAYNEKAALLRRELAARLGSETVALIRPRDNQLRLHTQAHRTADILYGDLGMQPPVCASAEMPSSRWTTLEELQNVDHLFLLTDDSNCELIGEYCKSEGWKRLRAVQANHVYTVNTTMWIGYYGPIAIDLIVDEIAESLLRHGPLQSR
ncbi:AraC family transcriptional regulator [Bacillus sp. 3255]|uniref:AraC family transcriptional regulator n=1 Tax=Bacillus sp. 3255 TaxID=2817904 RepID=UPI0028631871|nr:AraC family transcriptional regulator [Bacillus sp. 3255]MDR6884548.1 iron complex transport system substrate-binding protein [Bacillus sp. 3255]